MDIKVHQFNHNCRRAGDQLLRAAIEDHQKRVESSNRDIYQSAKDGAGYLRRKAVGAVTFSGGNFGTEQPDRSPEQMEKEGFVRTPKGWRKVYA